MREIGGGGQDRAGTTAVLNGHGPSPPLSSTSHTEGSGNAGDGGGGGLGEGGALGLSRRVAEAFDIKVLLEQNTDEVDNLVRALRGSYIKPGVGGAFFV